MKRDLYLLSTAPIFIIAPLFALLVIGLGAFFYWKLHKRNKKNLEQLKKMNHILKKKDNLVIKLEKEVFNLKSQNRKLTNPQKSTFNIYNQKILTTEDWATFKAKFDKSYPGYLIKLRAAHPTLTEAEERLFLFIKLNLTGKEIASILSISVNSVKKTRNRLRKRLELERGDSLAEFIQDF